MAKLSVVSSPHKDDLLQRDAQWIRNALTRVEDLQLDIAIRLQKIYYREEKKRNWTMTDLAQWCEDEDLGFGSPARVSRLISHAEAVAALQEAEILPAGKNPPEGALRPLAQALNKPTNPMPVEEAAALWSSLVNDDDTVPTQEEVREAVAKSRWGKVTRKQKTERTVAKMPRSGRSDEEITANNRHQLLTDLEVLLTAAAVVPIWDQAGLTKTVVREWEKAAATLSKFVDNMRMELT